MAEKVAFSWVAGTVCSERYSELAADCGDQLFEPSGSAPISLVPGPLGVEPSFSSDWPWPTSMVRSVIPVPAALMQSEDSTKQLSGPEWVGLFPASTSIDDLSPGFRGDVKAFLNAIRIAGGIVHIMGTRYSQERAYLMHWAWEIANGKITAEEVDEKYPMPGVNIQWDHGDDQSSIEAAKEMNDLYANQYPPALHSKHVSGNAIDMTISGLLGKQVKKRNGAEVLITANTTTDPTELAPVGASYGVYHTSKNPVYWSSDGH
jgi:hypothetical protein